MLSVLAQSLISAFVSVFSPLQISFLFLEVLMAEAVQEFYRLQVQIYGNQSPKFLREEAHPWAKGGGVDHLVETWQFYLQLCVWRSLG